MNAMPSLCYMCKSFNLLTVFCKILSSYKTEQILNIHFKIRIREQMGLHRGRNSVCPAPATHKSCHCPKQSSGHC